MATTRLIPIKDLKHAKFNPKSRTANINGLAKSIQEVGLLDPIKVSDKNDVIDGHRRIAAYKKLKLDEIDCIILKGELPALYAHINGQAKKLTGNETLNVYIAEPMAIAPQTRRRMEEAEEVAGRSLLERLAQEGLSMRTYVVACNLARAADQLTPETVRKILRWMLHFGLTGILQKAMNAGTPPGLLMAAVNKNKPIRPKFDMAK